MYNIHLWYGDKRLFTNVINLPIDFDFLKLRLLLTMEGRFLKPCFSPVFVLTNVNICNQFTCAGRKNCFKTLNRSTNFSENMLINRHI